MRIVYAGSPQFAVKPLAALLEAGAEVCAVITQPDRPVGRKKILTPTPVKAYAEAAGLPVFAFPKIRDCAAEVRALGGDIMITCAYGQLLSQEILNCFKGGVWNLHASLLPQFRGASPIQAAIYAGEEYTGVTVMKTELALDAGGILLVKRCKTGESSYGELQERLSALAAEAAVEAVEHIRNGNVQLLIQDEAKATYCKKINKADARIDFSRPSGDICRLVRASDPQPAAYCMLGGEIFNIFSAQPCDFSGDGKCGEVVGISADKSSFTVKCGDGAVKISEGQAAGGKRQPARDLINGRKICLGVVFD